MGERVGVGLLLGVPVGLNVLVGVELGEGLAVGVGLDVPPQAAAPLISISWSVQFFPWVRV